METMIENFINGNLADAKKSAKRFSRLKIAEYLMSIGWSATKAYKTSLYLKGLATFQEACDAK